MSNSYMRAGRPASVIARPLLPLARVAIVLFVVGLGSALISQYGSALQFAGTVCIIASAADVCVIAVFKAIVAYVEADEVRKGYTSFADAHQDVDEIDPVTHRKIRAAGEPYLSDDIRQARLSDANASIPQSSVPTAPGSTKAHRSKWFWITWSISTAAGICALLLRLGVHF